MELLSKIHKGELPASYSFVQITPDNLILTVLKKSEDSEDLILRCFETKGEKCSGKVILAKEIAIDAVHKIDLLENGLEDIITNGTSFKFDAGAYSIESFKLTAYLKGPKGLIPVHRKIEVVGNEDT